MRKLLLTLLTVFGAACGLQAQSAASASSAAERGKFILRVFTNFHSGFGASNDDRGFELERSYLGYSYTLPGHLELCGILDIGQSSDVDDYQRIAYLKNAMLTWRPDDRLTLSAGLISTTQFNYQEKFWGRRYLLKSFQDEYRFGSSADLGVSVAYRFAPWLTADAIIVNGEGYRRVQVEDGLLYGLGLTLRPTDGFSLRFYGGLNETADDGGKDVCNLAAFAGYRGRGFSVGAEYNAALNGNKTDGTDRYGLSVYASADLSRKFALYGRCDHLYSENGWDEGRDGTLGVVGAEWKLGKYVKLSPNFRLRVPKAEGRPNEYSAYLSCYFGL